MNIQSEAGSMNKHEEILSKCKDEVAKKRGYPNWETYENWIIDHNYPCNVALLLVGAMNDAALKAMRELEESPSPASPVREALENLFHSISTESGKTLLTTEQCSDLADEVLKLLAARTEGDGWVKVEDGLPELDESVNIAYWIQPAKGNGFWVVEVGYLQAITKRKTADGEKEYGEWKHGDQWNSSTPQYWARYRPLPSPPKTT
jgi:hypothetical protein